MIRTLQMNHSGILIVAAHPSEAKALSESANKGDIEYDILTTGVGGMSMAWSLQKRLVSGPLPEFILGAGIAGSYTETIKTGDVVIASSDCFADMGIDDNGRYISLFDRNLADPGLFPFQGGRIICRNRWFDVLAKQIPSVNAATVNMASGSEQVINRIRTAWDPGIETMEGAYFAYVCSMSGIPYVSLRAISNKVEPRQEKKWDIALALKNLKCILPEVLSIIERT